MEGESTVGALTSEANQMSWDLLKSLFRLCLSGRGENYRKTYRRSPRLLDLWRLLLSDFRPLYFFPTCNSEMQLRRRRKLRQILSEWEKGAGKKPSVR